MESILVVDDERECRELYARVLASKGFRVLTATDGDEALQALERHPVDLIVSDIVMPGMDGMELLGRLRARAGPYVPVVLVSGSLVRDDDVMRGYGLGADDYLTKPCLMKELCARIQARLRLVRASRQTGAKGRATGHRSRVRDTAPGSSSRPPDLVRTPGTGPILDLLDELSACNAPLLLTGETGTGKGVFARHVHASGPRSRHPFVTLPCTSIAQGLMAPELFGHE
ncbi:MAG: sigma-54-dependent Fis family transcriptional regulator, partial [Candidatus Riflebacteria bacterium]|nr:sigma-54-dependent Fis family transcriptional regulator [Candidatus Riflebacteria bacterium]